MPSWEPGPNDRRAIVGDVHGLPQLLRGILGLIGAIDADGERVPGWWLCQVGDLIHGGHNVRTDGECLAEGLRYFDALLLGNHELPHAYPAAEFPRFGGQTPLSLNATAMLSQAIADGRFRAAVAVDGWLVTHAGLHPSLVRHETLPVDTVALAEALNGRFADRVRSSRPVLPFDGIGRERGGVDPVGGIFWLDWRALSNASGAEALPQIVGHTPRRERPESVGDHLWCIDLGAGLKHRIAALIKDGPDAPWRAVVFPDDA